MTNLGRSSARAIGSEKHVLKRAAPFTTETTDCLILSDKGGGRGEEEVTTNRIYPDGIIIETT